MNACILVVNVVGKVVDPLPLPSLRISPHHLDPLSLTDTAAGHVPIQP